MIYYIDWYDEVSKRQAFQDRPWITCVYVLLWSSLLLQCTTTLIIMCQRTAGCHVFEFSNPLSSYCHFCFLSTHTFDCLFQCDIWLTYSTYMLGISYSLSLRSSQPFRLLYTILSIQHHFTLQ